MVKLKFEKSASEEEKRYNPNNKGIISVFRHGDKTPDSQLAPSGFEQAREKAEKTERLGVIVKDYASPVQRAQDMGEEMSQTLADQELIDPDSGEKIKGEKYNSRARDYLSFMEKGIKPKWFAEEFGKLRKQGPNKPLETYLSFNEKRPDLTTLSPKEMASRVGKVLYDQIRLIGRLKSGSKVNLADASHFPTLDVFIATFLKDKIEQDPIDAEGETVVEKMGGPSDTAEGFEIKVNTDEQGKLSAKISFRGKEYEVDMSELKELSEFYKDKKETEE